MPSSTSTSNIPFQIVTMSSVSNFVKSPIDAFLIEQRKCACEICQTTELEIVDVSKGITADRADCVPALLPCGHVFGLLCLVSWLARSQTCPSCRFDLKYELCGHQANPFPLFLHTIFTAPPTTSSGYTFPRQCGSCAQASDGKTGMQIWNALRADLQAAIEANDTQSIERIRGILHGMAVTIQNTSQPKGWDTKLEVFASKIGLVHG